MTIPNLPGTQQSLFALVVVGALASAPIQAHPGAGIVVDAHGQIYFVHGIRNRIIKLDTSGVLTTVAEGEEGKKLSNPHHLVADNEGNLYCVGDRDGQVWKISPDGRTTQVYPLPDIKGISWIGHGGDPFTVDVGGNIYCVNDRQFKFTQILKIGSDGRVGTLTGGDWGYADGKGPQARFRSLHFGAFAWTPDGTLLVTDNGTSIRKIAPDGVVTTLAGSQEGGFADGPSKEARFSGAVGLAADAQGNIYVADSGNRRVRMIAPNGSVSTLAGSGQRGHEDGPARKASFDMPVGIALDRDSSIYVLDYERDHPRVRRIGPGSNIKTIATVD